MKSFFYFIAGSLFVVGCASQEREDRAVGASLSSYAVGFQIFDLGDSLDLMIEKKHFKCAKSDQSKSFVISSSTQLTFLKALGDYDKIKGLFDVNIFSDSLVVSDAQNGKLINFKNSASPDWEALSKNKKSILLGYKHFILDENTARNLQLNIIPINEYLENHPLGKVEWIKVLGVLSGKYHQADSVFKEIESRYNAVKFSAKQSGIKVIAGEYYDGYWSVPGSSSYIASLVKDAGGEYLVKNITASSAQMNKESFVELLKEAEYWRKLTPMNWTAQKLSKEEVEKQFDVYPINLKGIMYCDVNKTHYFEAVLLHPDLELHDLIKEINGEEGSYFYRLIKVD